MQVVTPYRTIRRGEPPIRPETPTSSSGTAIQRRNVIHTLVPVDENGDRPDIAQQKIPTYNGFQASLRMSQGKCKAYFHMSYNQPPNKSVVNDVLHKLSVIITAKNMPFAFLAGDLPVYIIISTLKAENPTKYQNIVHFLGPFQTQCVMMNAIYKRYKNSGLEDLLVATGVVAEGSVDHALRGKHYKRGLRCLNLMYEALMSQILQEKLAPHLSYDIKEKLKILRDTCQSQHLRSAAHDALLINDDLSRLVATMFSHLKDSDMAQYWIDFLSMVDALMQNVHAVHACNWYDYMSSLRAMMPWMVAYDNNKYGRWLPDSRQCWLPYLPTTLAFFAQSLHSLSEAIHTPTLHGTCGLSAPWTKGARWNLIGFPSSRMKNNCWCIPEMSTMWGESVLHSMTRRTKKPSRETM